MLFFLSIMIVLIFINLRIGNQATITKDQPEEGVFKSFNVRIVNGQWPHKPYKIQ